MTVEVRPFMFRLCTTGALLSLLPSRWPSVTEQTNTGVCSCSDCSELVLLLDPSLSCGLNHSYHSGPQSLPASLPPSFPAPSLPFSFPPSARSFFILDLASPVGLSLLAIPLTATAASLC